MTSRPTWMQLEQLGTVEALLQLAVVLREASPAERREYLDQLAASGRKPRIFAEALERELLKGPAKFWPAPKVKA